MRNSHFFDGTRRVAITNLLFGLTLMLLGATTAIANPLQLKEQDPALGSKTILLAQNSADESLLDNDSDTDLLAEESDDELLAEDDDTDLLAEESDDELLAEDDDTDLLAEESDDELLAEDDDADLLAEEDDEDLLSEESDETLLAEDDEVGGSEASDDQLAKTADEAHNALFTESRYPSAATCGTCHPRHYDEWSVSQHSYAQLSPAYMALQNFINAQVNGTNGDFCIRCHNQIGMNQGESPQISNLERPQSSREGITCVVCHRVEHIYNKASGRIALVEGDLLQPVYGPSGDAELKRVLDNTDEYRVVTTPDEPGRKIHTGVVKFAPISTSTFCGTCHDVTLLNGFRLEEAFSEYRDSPAAKQGTSCQDCHMGKIQGKPSGYHEGPAAVVGGVETKPRKLTNHIMAGPDYSLVHPGIFPHNTDALQLATLEEWLTYDVEAGWGTDEFEDSIDDDFAFPEEWSSIDARYDAREIIDVQLERLEFVRQKRLEVLRNGYDIGEVATSKASSKGIKFSVEVKNITDGHNTPTGFTAERMIWLHTVVTDRDGTVVFESGDTDPNGDVRDGESSYVHAGQMPIDSQLFTLQSRFLVQNIRGGERERTVTIPYSTTALPFLRPTRRSLILTGESTVERNHRKGIEPLGHRIAKYKIKGNMLSGKGPYKATVKLMSQMIPINLITTIQVVGFDYGISPREVAEGVIAGREVLVERTMMIDVEDHEIVQD